MGEQKLDITWGTLWRLLAFSFVAISIFFSIKIFLALFLAVVISSGLEFIVTFLESRGVPRTIGAILVFFCILLGLVILAYVIIPLVILDANAIFSTIDKSAASYWFDPIVNFHGGKSITLFLNRLSDQLFSGDLSPITTFSDILGSLGLTVAVVFSSFYLSVSRDGVERFLRAVSPARYESQVLRVYHRARHKVGYWFRTQVLMSLVMAVLTYIALSILGVRHPFFLALLAGIFELVPVVGPIIAGAAAVVSALITSPTLAFYTLVVFLGLQQFESHLLVPLITRRTVGLHPVLVIIAILVGMEIQGLLGGLVAVPMAAVIQEIVSDWSSRKVPLPPQE